MKKLFTLSLLLILGNTVWSVFIKNKESRLDFFNSWIFKKNQTGPVIGNLGGMPVSIPQSYANFVEYQHDPHFLRPRKGEVPKRTYQSKFRNFGLDFRFPDMAALIDETRQDKRDATIYNTKWMAASVSVAPYHDKGSMLRLALGSLDIFDFSNGKYGYKQLPETLYGLVVHEVYGYDDAKRDLLPGNSLLDANIYYHVNKQGEFENFIECLNNRIGVASCSHHFYLKNTNAAIQLNYRKAFLPQWRQIQSAVTTLVLGFAVDTYKTQS